MTKKKLVINRLFHNVKNTEEHLRIIIVRLPLCLLGGCENTKRSSEVALAEKKTYERTIAH